MSAFSPNPMDGICSFRFLVGFGWLLTGGHCIEATGSERYILVKHDIRCVGSGEE